PKCSLGKRQMDEVALGETAAAAMRDVTYARQPFDATYVITIREREKGPAERQHERLLWVRCRGTASLDQRQHAEDALRCRSAARTGERHHRMRDIEKPHTGQLLHLPAISQQLPAFAQPDIFEL